MVFLWLLGLFLIFPFVELAILLWMAAHIGWLPTLALVVVTAVIGAVEVRREGFRVWIRFNEQLARGELPTEAMFDGLFVLAAGILLLTPGLITDVIGFAFLFPPIRELFKIALRKYVRRRLVATVHGDPGVRATWISFGTGTATCRRGSSEEEDDVIHVEYWRIP